MIGRPEPFRVNDNELAGYRIEGLVGRGGMAYVYRAVDQRLGRTVALKVLAPELATDDAFRKRFLRESRLAASIDHPNVIPIYDAGEADGMLYIAMRYVDGRDLKALLSREPQLDVDRVIEIFSQVAHALDAAHAHGLVHRDVKPANILMSSGTSSQGREHIYLSDFGITKRASSMSGVTAPGVIIGTMDYLAPEQIGGKAVSARTDVYALGCVIYQALTGVLPYVRDDDAALLWAHLMEPLPPVSHHRPDVPASADGVLLSATAKDPEDRYASCGEFLAELATVLGTYRPTPGRGTARPYASVAEVPPGPAFEPNPHSPNTHPPNTHPPSNGRPDTAAGRAAIGGGPTPPHAAPRRRPGRRWIWAALGGALAVALALVGFFVLRTQDAGTTRYTGNDVVPVSFDYPKDWGRADEGNQMVVSPHADAFLNLFTRPDQPNWGEIGQVLREDRDGAIGMYTFFNTIDYGSTDVQQTLKSNLPGANFGSPQAGARLGDANAIQISGDFSSPDDSAARLQFICYISEATAADSRNVHMIFFADADSFEGNQKRFDRIAESAVLHG
jgi:serine/threonine protein kinase